MRPIRTFSTKSAGSHSGSSLNRYSTLDSLDRLPKIFTIMSIDTSIIAGRLSPRLHELKVETVVGARVLPEHSAIEKETLSRQRVFMLGSLRFVCCILPNFIEPASCLL